MRIQKRYVGVIILALLVIGRCTYHLWNIHDLPGYRHTFMNFLPEQIIILRYLLSLSLRIVEIFASVGVLLLKECYRVVLIFLCWFNILTIYWKHPYQAIHGVAHLLWERFPYPGKLFMMFDLTREQLTWLWVAVFSIEAMAFSALVIFYLTRPKVKKLFN